MGRLPSRLQPLWPVVKRGHRLGARAVGAVGRATVGPARGLPRAASPSSRETVAAEPVTSRFHPVGAPFVVRRELPTGEPAGLAHFAARLEQRVPERYVLELAGGRLIGRHAAVVTAGGLLDQETSHYFDIAGWQEHPVFWNPLPTPATEVAGTVAVLAARGTGHNYYHFLMDALPRLGMLEQAFPGLRPDAWVVDRSTAYHRALLDLLGFDTPIIEPRPGLSVRAERLLVPSLPNVTTLISPETTTWLREHLPPERTTGLPERLYVTRGSAPHTRRMVHEEAILARLERRGFVRIDPGSLPVRQQIDHFAAARVVVAPHGAALANLSFCRPGVRLLECFAPGYLNGGYWSILSNIPDSHYRYLVGSGPIPPERPGALQRGLMDDIDVTPEQIDDALDLLLAY